MMQTLVKLDREVTRTLEIAKASFPSKEFPNPTIKMDLTGKRAGLFSLKNYSIRFNLDLMIENKETFIESTVPHEVAHLVVSIISPGAKVHGKTWKAIMHLFGVPSNIYHNYKVAPVKRQVRPYIYQCDCSKHYFTKRKHNYVETGIEYLCIKCKTVCLYTGKKTKGE